MFDIQSILDFSKLQKKCVCTNLKLKKNAQHLAERFYQYVLVNLPLGLPNLLLQNQFLVNHTIISCDF